MSKTDEELAKLNRMDLEREQDQWYKTIGHLLPQRTAAELVKEILDHCQTYCHTVVGAFELLQMQEKIDEMIELWRKKYISSNGIFTHKHLFSAYPVTDKNQLNVVFSEMIQKMLSNNAGFTMFVDTCPMSRVRKFKQQQ